MTELKRKLALWLCPELGEELAESKTDIAWIMDKAKSTYETLALTKDALEATEQALAKAQQENLQLIAELSIKEKSLKKAHKYKLHKPRKV